MERTANASIIASKDPVKTMECLMNDTRVALSGMVHAMDHLAAMTASSYKYLERSWGTRMVNLDDKITELSQQVDEAMVICPKANRTKTHKEH